jgi:hypothetical protein
MPPHYEANAPSPMLNNAYLKKKGTNLIKKKARKEVVRNNVEEMVTQCKKKCTLIFKGTHVDEYL